MQVVRNTDRDNYIFSCEDSSNIFLPNDSHKPIPVGLSNISDSGCLICVNQSVALQLEMPVEIQINTMHSGGQVQVPARVKWVHPAAWPSTRNTVGLQFIKNNNIPISFVSFLVYKRAKLWHYLFPLGLPILLSLIHACLVANVAYLSDKNILSSGINPIHLSIIAGFNLSLFPTVLFSWISIIRNRLRHINTSAPTKTRLLIGGSLYWCFNWLIGEVGILFGEKFINIVLQFSTILIIANCLCIGRIFYLVMFRQWEQMSGRNRND